MLEKQILGGGVSSACEGKAQDQHHLAGVYLRVLVYKPEIPRGSCRGAGGNIA